jgi:hypothetical protein
MVPSLNMCRYPEMKTHSFTFVPSHLSFYSLVSGNHLRRTRKAALTGLPKSSAAPPCSNIYLHVRPSLHLTLALLQLTLD